MAIIRAPRPDSGWYALDRTIAADARLSWAARGLLIYLLAKPDHWRVQIKHLQKETEAARIRTGRDGLYALLAELEECGYIARSQGRDDAGRLLDIDYEVREAPPVLSDPLPAEPLPARPDTAPPLTAEPPLDKIDTKTIRKKATRAAREGRPTPPDWIDPDAWNAFVLMREKIRAPLTVDAMRLTFSALEGLRSMGQDPTAVLYQSVQKSWRGVFPLRGGATQATGGRSSVETANNEALAEFRRRQGATHDAA